MLCITNYCRRLRRLEGSMSDYLEQGWSVLIWTGVSARSELRLDALQPVREGGPHRIMGSGHPRDDIRMQPIKRSLVELEICIQPAFAVRPQAKPPHLLAIPK